MADSNYELPYEFQAGPHTVRLYRNIQRQHCADVDYQYKPELTQLLYAKSPGDTDADQIRSWAETIRQYLTNPR